MDCRWERAAVLVGTGKWRFWECVEGRGGGSGRGGKEGGREGAKRDRVKREREEREGEREKGAQGENNRDRKTLRGKQKDRGVRSWDQHKTEAGRDREMSTRQRS
jgi:hypothetical protein